MFVDQRISRPTYYSRLISSFFITVLIISSVPDLDFIDPAVRVAVYLLALAGFGLFVLLLCKQRANDIGWHPMLLAVLSFVSFFFVFLGLIPGAKKTNAYGPRPSTRPSRKDLIVLVLSTIVLGVAVAYEIVVLPNKIYMVTTFEDSNGWVYRCSKPIAVKNQGVTYANGDPSPTPINPSDKKNFCKAFGVE